MWLQDFELNKRNLVLVSDHTKGWEVSGGSQDTICNRQHKTASRALQRTGLEKLRDSNDGKVSALVGCTDAVSYQEADFQLVSPLSREFTYSRLKCHLDHSSITLHRNGMIVRVSTTWILTTWCYPNIIRLLSISDPHINSPFLIFSYSTLHTSCAIIINIRLPHPLQFQNRGRTKGSIIPHKPCLFGYLA